MDESEKGLDSFEGSDTVTSATQDDVAHPRIRDPITLSGDVVLLNPHCAGMQELSNAAHERARVAEILTRQARSNSNSDSLQANSSEPYSTGTDDPLFFHLAQGLAYTVGSALGTKAPSVETCLATFIVPNSNGLTAGSRAWSKHAHRSQPLPLPPDPDTQGCDNSPSSKVKPKKKTPEDAGWWGIASGPVAVINEEALKLFWKVMNGASWRNLHWLPHQVLVYEVRVPEGYGMRWSQDQGDPEGGEGGEGGKEERKEDRPWMFRGLLEPTMQGGHEMRWRHPVSPS